MVCSNGYYQYNGTCISSPSSSNINCAIGSYKFSASPKNSTKVTCSSGQFHDGVTNTCYSTLISLLIFFSIFFIFNLINFYSALFSLSEGDRKKKNVFTFYLPCIYPTFTIYLYVFAKKPIF